MKRTVDKDDRQHISTELDKCFHPLKNNSDFIYSIYNEYLAPMVFNVSDSLTVSEPMVTNVGNHYKIPC